MQKIDKSNLLSTVYKNWEEKMGDTHTPYNSSNNPFYYDVVMNLLHCQRGVCAYTEIFLCDDNFYDPAQWKDGKYQVAKPEFSGVLDHFDSKLKKKQGWSYDNFFVVQKDINDKHKGSQPVDAILKPDNPDYDPFKLLEYDSESHIFIANTILNESLQMRINKMLLTLGINLSWVVRKRKYHLRKIVEAVNFGNTWEQENKNSHQFFTSFAMIRTEKERYNS